MLGGLIPASALTAAPTAVVTEQPAVPVQPQTAPAADVTPEQIATALQNANAGQTQSDAQPQEQPNTAAPVATAAPQAKSADAPAPAVTTPAPQPVTAPAPAAPVTAPPTLERAVPLYRAVQTTGTLLHVAAERGVTHARLNLKPVELGGIEVRLQSTPQGISAQLVADNPEAARMLSQASEDLRRQLAERDVTLLSLDVSTSSEQRHDNSAGGFGAFGDDSYRPGFGSSRRSDGSNGESVDARSARPPKPPSSSLTASSSTSSPDPGLPCPVTSISSSTMTSPVDLNSLDKVAKNKTTIDKDGFLKLFVAQLQNQDPTNGMDSGESMQQMTSFSMVEQMTNMAIDMKTSNTVSLIGRTVTYTDAAKVVQTGKVESVIHRDGKTSLTVDGKTGVDPTSITQVA